MAAEDAGVAMLSAIVAPVLVYAAVGAIDYTCAETDRFKMQHAADTAALSAAAQLAVDASGATAQRAEHFATAQLSGLVGHWAITVDSEIVENRTAVQVTVSGTRPPLMGNLLSGDWNISASATAQTEGQMPLCALGTASSAGLLGLLGPSAVIDLTSSSQVTAPDCLVQSNQNVAAEGTSRMTAGAVQAVGLASGSIWPTPQTGAPAMPDPFASTNVNVPSLCTDLNVLILSGSHSLAPGVHCGTIVVGNSATLTLEPGVHYFSAAVLTLANSATLRGSNVALVFDLVSFFTFKDTSNIELEGLTSGPLAGFVIATTRDNLKTFTISTPSAHKLLGVVYIPSGQLKIAGSGAVADSSDWTVIIAHTIAVGSSANLTLNANYSGSTVPVPSGVGPRRPVRLTN